MSPAAPLVLVLGCTVGLAILVSRPKWLTRMW